MMRILVPIIVAAFGLIAGLVLGLGQMKRDQELLAMMSFAGGASTVAVALYLHFTWG